MDDVGPVAPRMERGKSRHGHRTDREMHEGDERDGPQRGEIDADLIGRCAEQIEQQHIEIEDESAKPSIMKSGSDSLIQRRVSWRRGPGETWPRMRRACNTNCTAAAITVAATSAAAAIARIGVTGESECAADDDEQQQRPQHIGRDERQIEPALRAADAILEIGEREGREAEQRDDQRPAMIRGDEIRKGDEQRGANGRAQSPCSDRGHASRREKAAEIIMPPLLAIFGQQLHHRYGEAQRAQRAEHQHADRDIGEDAEFECAHPARQQHLARKGEAGRKDADGEGADGAAARARRARRSRQGSPLQPA